MHTVTVVGVFVRFRAPLQQKWLKVHWLVKPVTVAMPAQVVVWRELHAGSDVGGHHYVDVIVCIAQARHGTTGCVCTNLRDAATWLARLSEIG
jgi:hypothetical protein